MDALSGIDGKGGRVDHKTGFLSPRAGFRASSKSTVHLRHIRIDVKNL